MKRAVLALVSSLLLLLGPVPGWAAANTSTLDQSSTGADTFISGSYLWAQTFTAGRYGTLDYVDLYLSATSATVTVSLQGTTGNPPVPDGVIHGQKVRGLTTTGVQWVEFDFFSNYVVIPGHVYSLFVFPTDRATLYGSSTSDYAGGQALVFHGGTWSPDASYFTGSPADFGFRTYTGLAPATPTPTLAPTHTPAPTATPASASASAPATAASASSTEVASAATPTAAVAGVTSDLGSGSGSGGSGGLPAPLIAALILVPILVAGGVAFLLMQRLKKTGQT